MSIKQIETLVFDYGGVIVNIDDASVVKAMESLGVTAFKRLIHVRKIKRLMPNISMVWWRNQKL